MFSQIPISCCRTANESLSEENKMKQIKLDTLIADLEASRQRLSTLENDIMELNDQTSLNKQSEEKSLALKNERMNKLELDLHQKEELLSDAIEKYNCSQTKIGKMEDFTNSLRNRLSDLERSMADSEKVFNNLE